MGESRPLEVKTIILLNGQRVFHFLPSMTPDYFCAKNLIFLGCNMKADIGIGSFI